jgi:predicted phosphodiesterase
MDFLSIFDYGINDCINLFNKTALLHENQQLQGFFSNLGLASGQYLHFEMPDNLVVVGDIHGDLHSLQKILQKIDYLEYLRNEANLLIFLGDYIDRGKFSLEVLILLCQLKNMFPNNLFLLRGNHESFQHFRFSAYDFYTKIINKFGEGARLLHDKCISNLFDSFSVFCEIQDFSILLHGGLPIVGDDFFRNYKFNLSNVLEKKSLLEELLWNDPRELSPGITWTNSNRGLGKYFSKYITNLWLSNTNCKYVFRGHEPCKGYRLMHDNKIVTIFSSKDPYPAFESSFLGLSKKDIKDLIINGRSISDFISIV